jgi:hypothetical protein
MMELYSQVEDFLHSLKAEPAHIDELRSQSETLTAALGPLLEAVPSEPSLLEAQNITLEAFALGAVRGAGDGAILFFHDSEVPQPTLKLGIEPLRKSERLLQENLEKIVGVAETNWRKAHPDDLHLLIGYGKQENSRSLEEGGRFVSTGAKRDEFRIFLMASFKGGYAVGMAQAAGAFLLED